MPVRRFSQHNLFELALDRLAREFAAVNRIAKVEAVEHLNRALLEAKANAGEPEHPMGVSA